jgi:hypothetical protein
MARRNQADIYVAKVAFFAEVDGEQVAVAAGERVRAGHPLRDAQGGYFEPIDTPVHYEVEQATAGPGEKRGDHRPAA